MVKDYLTHPNAAKPADPNIEAALRELTAVLRVKNAHYGNSALEPKRIASRSDVEEQLRVRIDDKLSRWANCPEGESDEDTILDLAGYFVLLLAARRKKLPPVKMEWGYLDMHNRISSTVETLADLADIERGIK